jgi:AhpD family alkylhydroperoxidase
MKIRFDYMNAAPGATKAMMQLEMYVKHCGIEKTLLELIKVRASQINGCAYCIDMHTKDARAAGETEQRLYTLTAWREAPFYSDRERAALEWTEALTQVSVDHVPDEVYERTRKHFDDAGMMNLTTAVVVINGWNRIAVASRAMPGKYEPGNLAVPA